MNTSPRKILKAATVLWSAIVIGIVVSACGGGGATQSAGIGGTGINVGKGVVQGRVTGFGSIYINGAKFDTDSSQFIVDGAVKANQAEANLKVGMIVSLEVETEDGSYTGNALQVFYDDEVQGPVSGLAPFSAGETQRTFSVFGQTITIDDISTLFASKALGGAPSNPGFGFDTISINDVVEISGFRTSDNAINATYVEWKETLKKDSEVELRGTVNGYVSPTPEFMLDGFLVTFDPNTEIEVSGGLTDGVYVEVKGAYQTGMTPSVLASKIEQEDEGFGDDLDDVSLQGVISEFNDTTGDFKIDGLPIDTSGATKLSPANVLSLLENGVEIEVEGNIVGGKLFADEVELREGDSRIKAFVSFISPDNTRFEVRYEGLVGSIEIITDSQTLFDDESLAEVPNFSLDDMRIDDFVSVRGIESSNQVTAEIVKRLDPDDSELRGRVDSSISEVSITVLGITYGVGVSTEYEDSLEQPFASAADFFDALRTGDLVEIKDKEPANGVADEVSFED